MRTAARYLVSFLLLQALLSGTCAEAQPGVSNFRKLGFPEGLHDGIIRCIAQDRFGFIWIGTAGAINRFDGQRIHQYTNIPGDSSSPYGTQTRCMFSDPAGRFWIGTELGLMEYDFINGRFIRIPAFRNLFITSVQSLNDSVLYVGTRSGLYRYDTRTGSAFSYSRSRLPGHALIPRSITHSITLSGQRLFIGTAEGLITLDCTKDLAAKVNIPEIDGTPVYALDADAFGNIWMYTGGKFRFARLPANLSRLTGIDSSIGLEADIQKLQGVNILAASQGGLWVITEGEGLLHYDPSTKKTTRFLHDDNYPSGPSSNGYRCIFQDKQGLIWLGCYVEGLNYFEPGQNLFTTILPFPGKKSKVGRAVTIDKKGHIWMGNHDGLSRYDPVSRQYRNWSNEIGKPQLLYSNTIRSLECDQENNIWIGTGNGVNRYNSEKGEMEFIDRKHLPVSFYNSINEDKSGNIWFSTNDSASLYWYSKSKKQFYPISEHPQLKPFAGYAPASYVMEDSKQRLWISFSRKGLVMLDKRSGQLRQYQARDEEGSGIAGNQVIQICEDRKGLIWVTTFNGITGIDVEQNRFITFNNRNGLPGNMAAPIAIDPADRIWVGVNGGLTMIDADRKQISTFSMNEGLPSVGFHEHAGYTDARGLIYMPTYYGYFRFHPEEYKSRKPAFDFYLSGYSIFDKEFIRISETETQPVLSLTADQHSFTFHLAALNYTHPSQTGFAYKLDGFEKDWHFTKDPKAVYTNVPGGHYTFLYKATLGNQVHDTVPVKRLSIQVATRFYKTVWFRVLLFVAIAALFFVAYQYRTRQQKHLFQLKERAQLLEKEKALVMYENLKQQLNPHFLFNSLTSLNSLITAEPKAASEFLDSLSKTYRYILKSRDNETVPLSDEIRFAANYVKLQQTRFEKGFEVRFNIPEEYHHRKIAPVTLQNLIENAIKHNIIDEEAPLRVEISAEEGWLTVKNNLQKKRMVETSNRQGLANMQSLYSYLSHLPVEIIETKETFIVKLPLL